MQLTRTAAVLTALVDISVVLAKPFQGPYGNASDIAITSQNTINTTLAATQIEVDNGTSTHGLQLSVLNNLSSNKTNAYLSGLDPNNKLVLLQPDGTWLFVTADPSKSTPQKVTTDVKIPLQGDSTYTNITLPGYISSARLWFADGELEFFTIAGQGGNISLVEPSAANPSDPAADVNWGFVEFVDSADSGVWADISYVDFVGLPLGLELTAMNGTKQSAKGLPADAVSLICNDLKTQAAVDGQPWDELCVTDSSGNLIRVHAPPDQLAISSNISSLLNYWAPYVDEVWTHFETSGSNFTFATSSSNSTIPPPPPPTPLHQRRDTPPINTTTNTLTIDTQTAAGLVSCQVSSSLLTCAGDNRGYAKPSSTDIFGCNTGAFALEAGDNDVHRAVVPRLCAAFNRSTLLTSDAQPSLSSDASPYYGGPITNYYSKFVHSHEVDGRGYAFSYDDVLPIGGPNPSGMLQESNPRVLTVIVGGPKSGGS